MVDAVARAVDAWARSGREQPTARAVYEIVHVGCDLAVAATTPDPELVSELSRAAGSNRARSVGWALAATAEGDFAGTRAGVRVMFAADEVVDLQRGVVLLPAVRPRMHPGYFTIVGQRGEPRGSVLRCYLSAIADAAGAVVSALLGVLQREGHSFVVKAADSLTGYLRRDSIVVYLPGSTHRNAVDSVVSALPDGALVDNTPLLALRIAPGVALAQDPGDGRSFGWHRSSVLAGCLAQQPSARTAAAIAAARRAFAASGIDPYAPWRSLASVDDG